MKQSSKTLVWLASLVALMALIAAAAGLFWPSTGMPFDFSTPRGDTTTINGQGLYFYDTYFKAPIFRGTDAVTLFVLLPLLIFAIFYYRRGTLRGQVLLAAALTFFLYNSISVAFGVAYNPLILVYTIYFSASLFAFILALTSIDLSKLAASIAPSVPTRGIAILMMFSSLSVLVWLMDIFTALSRGGAPENLGIYTTEITYPLDLGVIPPVALLTAFLLLRRRPLGYLLAPVMLVLLASVGVVVIGQTIFQALAGITLNPGQLIGYVGTFVILGSIATVFSIRYFRGISQ